MSKFRNVYAAVLLSSFVMSQLAADMASAAPVPSGGQTANIAGAALGRLGSVSLGSNIKAWLEDVNIWQQASGNILTYTIHYTNSGSSAGSLMNYFSKVTTPGGSLIMGHPITVDANKKNVLPKESIRVTYYVNIKQLNSLKGLKIPMYVWDANAAGYLKHAGTFTLPANYSPVTAMGKSLKTTINNMPVTAGIQSFELYKYNGKAYAKVGFNLTNQGKKALEDPGYGAYLVSAGGSVFKMALSAQTKFIVQPGVKRTLYYLCELPAHLKTDHMKLQFTQTDEALQLEYAKFAYELPAAKAPDLIVGNGAVKKMLVENNSIEAELQNAGVWGEDGQGKWSFQLRMKNTGNKTVKLPAYELAVKSTKGKSFPVDSKGLSGLTLKPLEEKIISLSVHIPLEVEQNTLRLEMLEAVGKEAENEGAVAEGTKGTAEAKANMNLPIAYFTIPYILHTDAQKGVEYPAVNSFGAFSYNLESLQRLPWRDEDILTAKLRITNTQSTNLSLPELKGSLQADLLDLSASTELFMDQGESVLRPGESTEMIVLAHIPYTQQFKTLKIHLYSLEKEEKTAFLSLNTPGTLTSVEPIKQGESYVISGNGKNAEVNENKTSVYSGGNSNIVITELLLNSLEKRQSKMAKLHAYFETAGGEIYEAAANQPDTPLSPGVQQIITFSAKLPKSIDPTDLTLYIGQEVTGNKISASESESEEEPTGYYNAASMRLQPVVVQTHTSLAQIPLYPYTLSVLNSNGWKAEGSDSLNITVNYHLQRALGYDMGNYDHKLVLKMTDPSGQSQEKKWTIGTELTEGDHNTYTATFSSSGYKDLHGGYYQLTLYEELLGERIELGSQTFGLSVDKE